MNYNQLTPNHSKVNNVQIRNKALKSPKNDNNMNFNK